MAIDTGTVAELALQRQSRTPVLNAPGRRVLTCGDALGQVERTVIALRDRGIGPQDRVAVVLPNGPELGMSFLAISSAAVFAPLNPQYSKSEFVFYLRDLGARVLITQAGFCPAATEAAAELGIPAIGLLAQAERAAGTFVLEGPVVGEPVPPSRRVQRSGIAMLLHSSGTTARPKLIPLTHDNLCASALNIARTLTLDERDVCLNIMPLFHIHGLVAAFLASLTAGAAVFSTSGFNAFRFARWMSESGATWCTAAPAMYQALLARGQDLSSAAMRQFRLLRSCSASLPVPVWERLENVFGCPVLNSYGMTEASHQIASNPLPPQERKLGTVGPAAGPEIAILGHDGILLGPGRCGEVVIRGETITSGYLSPETAKSTAFHDGWFRTGDEGRVDEDGYLSLTGRLKEMINVGGEKVAPAELDELLIQHPAVAEAVAFSVPCRTLGERIYAAVVLRGEVREAELRDFLRARLARFKVPEKIIFVESIPRGTTGKVQRIGMAERMGIDGPR